MRIENHIHYIMLYHFEKDWNAAHSFRDLNEFSDEGTISKKWKDGSRNLNRAIQISQMKKEEINHQISTTRHF